MRIPIVVVQGGQFGSEAKGAITGHLRRTRNVDSCVRTGSINAGHSVMYGGKKYVNQQLPCGWVNPNTRLILGPGAYIHPETLVREVEMVNAAMPESNVLDRLFIDTRCGTHTEAAEAASKAANRHHRMGATGKGCSEAIVSKIRDRNDGYLLYRQMPELVGAEVKFTDTVDMLNKAYDDGAAILIEGTQGTLLDLHLGPYPFTTSRMTSAANWIAEAGLSPSLEYEIVLVCRTYPIRVAGNSGPMDNEIEWTDLARAINVKLSASGLPSMVSEVALLEFEQKLQLAAYNAQHNHLYKSPDGGPDRSNGRYHTRLSEWTAAERSKYRVAASELHRDALNLCHPSTVTELRKLFEMTTVTKKLRRIAEWTWSDIEFAVMVNRPSWIALTFADYLEPELAGVKVEEKVDMLAFYRLSKFCKKIEDRTGVHVDLVSTGSDEGCILGWRASWGA